MRVSHDRLRKQDIVLHQITLRGLFLAGHCRKILLSLNSQNQLAFCLLKIRGSKVKNEHIDS